MPDASLLLPLLARLLRLIPSVLGLLPVLLRPPPLTPHCSPLTPSSRPPFAVGRSPFGVSPSASSGQALSNHERPLHRPAYPNLLALPPSYRRPPVFRLWAPTRPNRGPADPAPRQPDPQKNPPNLAPAGPAPPMGEPGQRARVPQKPHRNHRRLPLPCRWKPASSLTPACTVPPPKGAPLRPTRQSGVRGEPALSLPKEPALSLPKGNPVVIPRPKTPPKCTPRRLKSFLEKTLTRARPPQNRPSTPHPPQPLFVRFPGPNLESAIT